MKKVFLFIAFLILITTIVFFIKHKRKYNNEDAAVKANNIKKDITIKKLKVKLTWQKVGNYENAYAYNIIDSNIYLHSTNAVNCKTLHNAENNNNLRFNIKAVETCFDINDTLVFYSSYKKTLEFYSKNKFIKSVKQNAFAGEIIFNKQTNAFFYLDTIYNKNVWSSLVIKSNKTNFEFNINSAIEKLPKETDSICNCNVRQGKLYNYSKDTIAFLLEKIDAIILININDGKHRMQNTISKYTYVPMKSSVVEDKISGITMMKCEPSTDIEYLHTSLGITSKFVFIKSDILGFDERNNPCEFIDVYEKYSFKYLYSIKFNVDEKNPEIILKLEATENDLYILTTKKNFYSLKYYQ